MPASITERRSWIHPTRRLWLFLIFLSACSGASGLPKVGSLEYRNLVAAFYVGLAGLQTGEDVRAKEKLTLASQIAPGEPAAWANLGLLAVRQQEFDVAFTNVEKARSLAPDNSQIEALLGLIESKRGRLPEAIVHLKKAVEQDPKNLKALYALAQETERQSTETSDADARRLLDKILQQQPDNLAVLLDATRLAAKNSDGAALEQLIDRLRGPSASWPEEARQQFAALEQAAGGSTPRSAGPAVAFLRNVLLRIADYRQSLNAVKTPVEFVGDPFLKFLKLPSPDSSPAEADSGLRFEPQPLEDIPAGTWDWVRAIPLNADEKPALVAGNQREIAIAGGAVLAFPASATSGARPSSALAIDFNYDFKTDFILAGAGGLRFYEQAPGGKFTDVTPRARLSASTLKASLGPIWAFDFDLDGDLDVLCGATATVLRNNGDGSFQELKPFPQIEGIVNFVSADLDGDGDPDLAMLATKPSTLAIFSNERLGQYRRRQPPVEFEQSASISAADLNSDGLMDLIVVRPDGEVLRLSDKDNGRAWESAGLARIATESFVSEPPTIHAVDFDNNGAIDLAIGRSQILLNHGSAGFKPLAKYIDVAKLSVADPNGDGRLDLVGIGTDGKPVQLINRGTRSYHYQVLRTRASQATGDQRINSFGVGGVIEIRSGLLTQKQIITEPWLHFGLGENPQTDVARIVWPNGLVQAEFELKADGSILAQQRLKGSCPMLFAWDGRQMSFVKDCSPWNPALGLRINAQTVAEVDQTEEWLKIPGAGLAPRNGVYELRVTAELWETFYIDHYSLMAVDHPPGTAVFTDERFSPPQPKPQIFVMTSPKPFASARDDRGQDVSATVAALDREYLDGFGRGQYQGLTRDHWVELELGQDAPRDKPLVLVGHGWLHPTDATINIALGQHSGSPPQGLTLETPDVAGRWSVARAGLGFLSGKNKTMVVDLTGVFRPDAPRKLRLRTNMEIYWDQLEWAEQRPPQSAKLQRLETTAADLSYRGFSTITQANASSPELPDYNRLQGSAPRWRDLTGYYTRYGDVRELLQQIDDRLVLMNAGDELRLRFPAPPPPPEGWSRDFVMIGDGWTKDGDYNCVYAETVLPLPYHGIRDYNKASTNLFENPAYQRHPRDWQVYHTRYVTPESFLRALR